MTENVQNIVDEPIEEGTNEVAKLSDDSLKEAVNKQLRKIQRQNMLLGFQTACHTVLSKIYEAERKPGKRTMNDYRRLIKELKGFCETGISRKVNTDGETEPVDNINNTKLMEETNESNVNENN